MQKIIIPALALILSGCATPQTILHNDKTNKTEVCGGSRTGAFLGGMIGYQIEKDMDEKCAAAAKAKGYKPAQ